MATWKVVFTVLKPKEGDTNIFPESEIVEKEIHFEENKVFNIYTIAQEIAQTELIKRDGCLGYEFKHIDRTDKKTSKNYHNYMLPEPYLSEWEQDFQYGPTFKVWFNQTQLKEIETAKNRIMERIAVKIMDNSKLDKNRGSGTHLTFPYERVAYLQKSSHGLPMWHNGNGGTILSHHAFECLANFYNNISPLELEILNLGKIATVEEYESAWEYFSTL
jgi:hypothetical protein